MRFGVSCLKAREKWSSVDANSGDEVEALVLRRVVCNRGAVGVVCPDAMAAYDGFLFDLERCVKRFGNRI